MNPDYAQALGKYQATKGRMIAKYPDKVKTTPTGAKTISAEDLPEGPDKQELAGAKKDLSDATEKMFDAHHAQVGREGVGQTTASCPLKKKTRKERDRERRERKRKCPHVWVEKGRETPEQTVKKNEKSAKDREGQKGQEQIVRGHRFENKVIRALEAKGMIESTSITYECEACGAKEEIDILMKNGQMIETKSITSNQTNKYASQSVKIEMLQSQFGDPAKRPKAIVDGSLPDSKLVEEYYRGKGFEAEIF